MGMSQAYGPSDDNESLGVLDRLSNWDVIFGIPLMYMARGGVSSWQRRHLKSNGIICFWRPRSGT